eukprot:gene15573-21028_t
MSLLEEHKVLLNIRSVGEAPALKKNKFKLNGTKPIIEVESYLKKLLGPDKSIYIYCGSGFSPTPDQLLQDLFDCFQIGGELTITYGIQESW